MPVRYGTPEMQKLSHKHKKTLQCGCATKRKSLPQGRTKQHREKRRKKAPPLFAIWYSPIYPRNVRTKVLQILYVRQAFRLKSVALSRQWLLWQICTALPLHKSMAVTLRTYSGYGYYYTQNASACQQSLLFFLLSPF